MPLQWYAHAEHDLTVDAGAALLRPESGDSDSAVLHTISDHLSATSDTANVPIDTLRVLVHSPSCLTVQAPLTANASASSCRHALMQQAALLTGGRRTSALRLFMDKVVAPLPAPDSYQWYRGVVVPQRARDWADQWAHAIGAATATVRASAIHVCDAAAPRLKGWHLGIGSYGPHTEYTLWHGTNCAYLYYTPLAQTPTDRAYFAALLLNRLKLTHVGIRAAWVYGPDAHDAPSMPPIAGVQPRLAQFPEAEKMARLNQRANTPAHPLRWGPVHSVLWNATQETTQ